MSVVTIRILDAARGCPAADVPVLLEQLGPGERQHVVGQAVTGVDGRTAQLVPAGTAFEAGRYRVTVTVRAWFGAQDIVSLFPQVVVPFDVRDTSGGIELVVHMTPHSYAVYREPR